MSKNIYIIFRHKLIKYPPAISLIKTLIELGHSIIFIGECGNKELKKNIEEDGCKVIEFQAQNKANFILDRFIKNYQFSNFLKKFLANKYDSETDIIWLLSPNLLFFYENIVKKYKVIIHFYEITDAYINWKYKIVNPFFNFSKIIKKAYKIVHCQYDRAQLFKWTYNLKYLPSILPNKPYDDLKLQIETSLEKKILEIKEQILGKRVILYQGIINDTERRLDEYCEAVMELPDNYVLLLMGNKTNYSEYLRNKYKSKKIIYIPFINPPSHLIITKICHIGILTYIPTSSKIPNIFNTIYCAPNKIYEYAKFGIPMIGNDVPGLKYPFEIHKCGEIIEALNSKEICKAILKIDNNFEEYSKNALSFYNSIDLKKIINGIITSI